MGLNRNAQRDRAAVVYRALVAAGESGLDLVEWAVKCHLSIDLVLSAMLWLRGKGVGIVAMSQPQVEGEAPVKTRYALRSALPDDWRGWIREAPIPSGSGKSLTAGRCPSHRLYEISRTLEGVLRVQLTCASCPSVVIWAPLVRDMRKRKVVAWREAKAPVGLDTASQKRLVAEAHERLDAAGG